MIQRRGFLFGLAGALGCAPAIVRASSIMRVRPVDGPIEWRELDRIDPPALRRGEIGEIERFRFVGVDWSRGRDATVLTRSRFDSGGFFEVIEVDLTRQWR